MPKKTTRPAEATTKPEVIIWAAVMVGFFVTATFVAHWTGFTAGETVFLNLTVALTSGGIGTFLGERVALDKLLK